MATKPPISRTQPAIWVRRLVILSDIAPITIIRDIPLRRGLNVIWGEGIGHAVGKSTFCRLIRYCLGESDFAEAGRRADISNAFPNGAVAAEILVNGELWNVLRPYANHGRSRAGRGQDLAALVQAENEEYPWQAYENVLATATLGRLKPPLVGNDGEPTQWGHLLAACTRDQSTRLSDVLTWRQIKAPSRKEDRSALYRVLLGLLDSQEAAAANQVARATADLKVINDRLTRLEHDARVRFQDHWPSLARDQALHQDPESAWESQELGDEILHAVVNRLRHADQTSLVDLESRIDSALERRARSAISIGDIESKLQSLTANRQILLLAARGDPDARRNRLDALDKQISDGSTCQHLGQINYPLPLGECTILTERLTRLRDDYKSTGAWDAAANLRNEELISKIRVQEDGLRGDLSNSLSSRNRVDSELTILRNEQREVIRRLDRLDDAYGRIVAGLAVRAGADPESARLRAEQSICEENLIKAKEVRHACLTESKQQIIDVQHLYHTLVQSIAGSDYWGRVDLDADGISLSMGTDTATGGETYKALAVPIADLTALVRGIVGHGIHPGLLIHDCPREADMNASLYGRLFDAVKGLEDRHGGLQDAAFQYIITTTTPPPDALATDPWVRCRLNAGSEDGLLFRKKIASEKQESFLSTEEGGGNS